MFLLDLLIAVLVSQLLTALHGLHGFLRKLGNIHMNASLLFYSKYNRSLLVLL